MSQYASRSLKIAVVGLSLSSSWGNGHATTYRALLKGLRRRGHEVTFFERQAPWYADHRDYSGDGELRFYENGPQLLHAYGPTLADADLLIIGSFVSETAAIVEALDASRRGVLAFYDIDTPVTMAALADGRCTYLTADLVPRFDLYLSFSGGRVLDALEAIGARRPRPLYCSVDPDVHAPAPGASDVDLGYLGTYSADRQAGLSELLLEPARRWRNGRFAVAGAQYPDEDWPENVSRVSHVPPAEHAAFYCRQRFTLNLTRADMRRMGHSPSVRLFEAGCCGTPVVSDYWAGLETFFEPGVEVLVAAEQGEVLDYVRRMPEEERRAIGARARDRVLASHTGDARARELESYHAECS